MQIGPTDVGTIAAYVRQNRRADDSRVRPPFIFVGEGDSAIKLRARVIDRAGDFSCLTAPNLHPSALGYATLIVAIDERGPAVVKAR